MNPEIIDDKNWILYAARNYNNPSCHDVKEFFEDIKRFKYIKKAYTKLESSGEISDHACRLVLNHIVILNNVFGPYVLSRIMVLRLGKQLHFVKPFMLFLRIWPDYVDNITKRNRIDLAKVDDNLLVVDFLERNLL
jgi:hypothetical protein